MKKILFCLILLLFPFYVSAKEYSVKDLKLKMDFDDNWYVFTKDNLDDNEDIEKLGLSKEYVKSSFKNGIFLDALLKDKSLEFVGVATPTDQINNLANYSDREVKIEFVTSLKNELESRSYKDIEINFEKLNGYKYLVVSFYDPASSGYIYKYFTFVNGNAFNFQIEKRSSITDEEKKYLKNIMEKTNIDIIPSKAKEIKKSKNKTNNVLVKTLIGALVGGIVGGIMALINKKKESKN